ncbi:MAG: LPXTG cell wall anchor domain-containing protein, partial [Candidatus Heimdallarchaeota archaeon]|nr:LPXTG cell wall anchor domain-containing protein [Candidatus Heimdallarchaeota archaeon]
GYPGALPQTSTPGITTTDPTPFPVVGIIAAIGAAAAIVFYRRRK